MKKLLILTFVIYSFSVQVYSQVYVDQIYSDIALPDAAEINPPAVYPVEVFSPNIIQDRIYDSTPNMVEYSPRLFGGMRANLLPGSFSQDTAWDLRNNFGFSLGAHEGYYFSGSSPENTPLENPLLDSINLKDSSYATSLSASAFTNYASNKSAIHLDYGAGYRFYPEQRNSIDGIDHSVNAAYMYQINNRVNFRIHDHFSSSSNDPLGDIFSMNASLGRLLAGSSYFDVFFTPRRYTRNTASANFSADVTGKGTNVTFFGSYDNYWYENQSFGTETSNDYYSARVGAGLSQRITRWLSFGSSYSIQLNNDLKDSQTHRVEVGRFQFDLSPDINVYFSGGIEIADTGIDDGYKSRLSTRAGISYTTEVNRLYAEYSRTMHSVSGFREQLPSDTVLIGLGQPLGNRTSLRLMWHYLRSSDVRKSGTLSAHQCQASIQFIIASGLYASANYSYRYQINSIHTLSGIPNSDRSTISGGLVYSWPSRRLDY